jgi:hypothetical protein
MTKDEVALKFQSIPDLSVQKSKTRLEKAERCLGTGVVLRILAFTLFLMGANRRKVSQFLGMPLDTLKSLLKRTFADGLPALEDRRSKSSNFLPPASAELRPQLLLEDESLVIQFDERSRIHIPRNNPIQCRTVLLTLTEGNFLSMDDVAQGLELSCDRLGKLRRELLKNDVQALIDQRKGQRQDYRVTPEVKSEIVQQFVLNLQTRTATSSEQLNKDLAERCHIYLSARAIRLHVAMLGLGRIRGSLPQLLDAAKKTQPPD